MLRKLLSFYQNSLLYATEPTHLSENFYLFFDEANHEWLAIPKTEICDTELRLLKTVYQLIESPTFELSSESKIWHDFLLINGEAPSYPSEPFFRFIQFQLKDNSAVEQEEIESALKGFFTEDIIIVWENRNNGIIVEEKKRITLSEKEIISLSETVENDFYVKISFYIGKFYPFTSQLSIQFQQEHVYFIFGQSHLTKTNIYTFERVFPAYIASQLPEELTGKLKTEVADVFNDEPEMFETIKSFLENNLNASVTAKKLYIHRNTLQYRLDKFIEKTGIDLKDFYGAFTVFLACLLFEQENTK